MKKCFSILLLTVLLSFSTAQSAIIYSTYSSPVNVNGEYSITNVNPTSDMAARFTVSSAGPDYYLDSIEMYLRDVQDVTNDFLILGISSHDSTNNIPDTNTYVLSPVDFTTNIPSGNTHSTIAFDPVERPILYAGNTYWLIASVENPESSLGDLKYYWALNADFSDSSALASRPYSGAWDDISLPRPLTYQLNGTAVPIPGAIWLLGSGLICLIGLRRKNR